MQKKTKMLIFAFTLTITSICAWSPWLTRDRASELAESQFDRAWQYILDGCGTYGTGLGAKDFRKVPFGAYVTLNYQCGLVPPREPVLHTTVYVSFVGIAFGYPKP